jgi:hypothetical protein
MVMGVAILVLVLFRVVLAFVLLLVVTVDNPHAPLLTDDYNAINGLFLTTRLCLFTVSCCDCVAEH